MDDNLDALLADLQNTVPGAAVSQTNHEVHSTSGYGMLKGTTKKEPQANGNLSELDSLLQDLSAVRYGNGVENKSYTSKNIYSNQQSPGLSQDVMDQIQRPSVDSLLDELNNTRSISPVYAIPHEEKPKGGRHVTITVKETKTERVSGQPSYQTQNLIERSSAAPLHNASSATKELDDLMSSLADFKINSNQHSVTDYARPNNGVQHYQISEETVVESTRGNPHRDQLELMLGNLQADMSRQGVNTQQKGCCASCDKPIVGQVITALGKQFHPEHFTCNHCNQELGTRNFFERDGNPYCEADYHNLFSPRCSYCNGPILDKCVTALDKTYHIDHFFCAQCGQQFGDDGFHERDGKPYCRKDYFDMFAPRCAGCNQAIMENYISALNSQFHPDCFVCRDCKKAVTGKSFYAMEGLPVCPGCVGVDEEDQ